MPRVWAGNPPQTRRRLQTGALMQILRDALLTFAVLRVGTADRGRVSSRVRESRRSEPNTKRNHASGPNARDCDTDFFGIFPKRGSNIVNEGEPSLHIARCTKRPGCVHPDRSGRACSCPLRRTAPRSHQHSFGVPAPEGIPTRISVGQITRRWRP